MLYILTYLSVHTEIDVQADTRHSHKFAGVNYFTVKGVVVASIRIFSCEVTEGAPTCPLIKVEGT